MFTVFEGMGWWWCLIVWRDHAVSIFTFICPEGGSSWFGLVHWYVFAIQVCHILEDHKHWCSWLWQPWISHSVTIVCSFVLLTITFLLIKDLYNGCWWSIGGWKLGERESPGKWWFRTSDTLEAQDKQWNDWWDTASFMSDVAWVLLCMAWRTAGTDWPVHALTVCYRSVT